MESHALQQTKKRSAAVHRLRTQYNHGCEELVRIIASRVGIPANARAPVPIPIQGFWELEVDDAIWNDIGLDPFNPNETTTSPDWLCNEDVRSGIRAMLDISRCEEEQKRLIKETYAAQDTWFEDYTAIHKAIIGEEHDHQLLHLAVQLTPLHSCDSNAKERFVGITEHIL